VTPAASKGRFDHLPLLPDSRLLPGRPLLLVIDMQYDFMEPSAPCYNIGAEATVEPTARLIDAFRRDRLPIIFTREAHRPGRVDAGLESDPDYQTPAHTVEGTRGFEIVEALRPAPGELVVDKRRYSCFLGTELELLLHLDPVDTLVICGVSSDICVHWTSGEAFQRDYHVRVVEDCTAGTSLADHDASLLILRNLCSGGRAITSDNILQSLPGSIAAPVA
jgi:nicotinamidase-related amidase